jgi:4-hydroxybenzoate polyprenyltransferase
MRWLIFMKERFSPATYLPMIALFVTMNGVFGTMISGTPWIGPKLALVIPLILSFFFRMRLFDEIKDYQTDIKVNPGRPLPRGLLRINQVKKMIVALILLELGLTGVLVSVIAGSELNATALLEAVSVSAAYVTALSFSLLMYNEFFLSDLLRHRLTTYAVSHTFASVLLGALTGMALTGLPTKSVSFALPAFLFLTNWPLFNLFEFARKSFAPSEEREAVPSYSKNFGVPGAWALSASQILLANATLYLATGLTNRYLVGTTAVFLFVSCYYLLARSERSANVFRLLTSVVLLASELSIIFWWR